MCGEDLYEAATIGREAATGLPPDHRTAAVLSNLGKCLQTRYAAFGELANLAGGLRTAEGAVNTSLDVGFADVVVGRAAAAVKRMIRAGCWPTAVR